MKKITLMSSMILLLVACSTTRLTPEQKVVKGAWVVQQVQEAIDSRKMTIEMNYVTPFRSGLKHLDYGYDIRLSGDTLYSYLPYYGRAYSVPYGGGKGLIFNAPIRDMGVSYPKKGLTRIDILVQNEEDQYIYMIDLLDNGHADLLVRSREREQISFSGELKMEEKDEK